MGQTMPPNNDINTASPLLLDTHVLVWFDGEARQLGRRCRVAIDRALGADRLVVSAITFWEVALLISKGRLEMDVELDDWRADLLAHGLRELPINGLIGVRAVQLRGLNPDPADRLIAATAEIHECVLATSDKDLLSWDSGLPRINARQ